MTSRLHPFDGIDNVRDYGDYATAAGRRIRPGRLFRSGHHASATLRDRERLGAWRIGTIVDLRRSRERERQPSKRPDGFVGQVIENDLDNGREAPHIAFLKSGDLSEESGRRFMTETYRRLPFEDSHVDLFRRYFQALGESEKPVLIHCVAGKDRTGLLAALTHHAMGVHPDDLIEDYLLTNSAVDLERRAPDMARRLAETTGKVPSHAAVVAFLGVEAGFLEAAFAAIAADHGDLDGYLRDRLGVDPALRDRIGDRLSA